MSRFTKIEIIFLTNDISYIFCFLRYFVVEIPEYVKKIKESEYEDPIKQKEELSRMVGYGIVSNMKSKRFIKTHLPFSLMPPSVMKNKAKVIYVARNPKDVIVSFYYFHRLTREMSDDVDFKQFWDYFEKDLGGFSFY
jgi:hypothetical protein